MFFRLKVHIDSIVIGERIKGGTYRPCLETIPSSTIKGVFRHFFGKDVKGVGHFEKGTYEQKELIYSVKDKYLEAAKMPIISSYLAPKNTEKIKADIFIVKENHITKDMFDNFIFTMGGLKSRGFGRSEVINVEEVTPQIKQGWLKIRIFEDEVEYFAIQALSPLYGYLFHPTDFVSGFYKRALFEGSLVKAPEIFLEKESYYDE